VPVKSIKVEIHEEAAKLLFTPSRYKTLWGGRGSAKSWSIARAFLCKAIEAKRRFLCTREYQRNIQQSVLHLLEKQIYMLGMGDQFRVMKDEIRGTNGSHFIFSGLHHNVKGLMSVEDIDYAWVEQAEAVTKPSLDLFTPSVRGDRSEIWLSLNPELEQDEAYQRFVLHPSSDNLVLKMLWSDNPWFPDVLEKERLECLERDPIGYRTIWQGECRASVQGAIYADELQKARDEGRVTSVPIDRALPVHTAWDLGYLDPTAIWFFQWTRAGEIRLIDYFEDCKEDVTYYIQAVRDKGYMLGRHIPPHDIKAHHFAHKDSAYEIAKGLGFKFEEPMGPAPVETGIHAVRMAFSRMWFDADRCAAGLQRLAHYRRAFNSSLQEFKAEPVHDIASHGADALRYAIVGYEPDRSKRGLAGTQPRWREATPEGGWMGR
jgi:phage terminase large subunit